MRYCLINSATGKVETATNIEEGDQWDTPDGYFLVPSEEAGPGWSYDGVNFTKDPVIDPPEETADDIYAQIKALVARLPEGSI